MSGGTLGGTGTIKRDVRFEAGSAMVVNPTVTNQLTVTGAVTLNGSPAITSAGRLTKPTYTLLTAASITGTFDAGTVPATYYSIVYTADQVKLVQSAAGTAILVK